MSEEKAPVEVAKEKPKAAPKGHLDRSKPFSEIHGGVTAAAYFQDGKYFDGAGKPCKL